MSRTVSSSVVFTFPIDVASIHLSSNRWKADPNTWDLINAVSFVFSFRFISDDPDTDGSLGDEFHYRSHPLHHRRRYSDNSNDSSYGFTRGAGAGSGGGQYQNRNHEADSYPRMMPPINHSQGVMTDSQGLIVPKKLANPCLESMDRQNLHRELMFNQKMWVYSIQIFE